MTFQPREWQARALGVWRDLHGVLIVAGVGAGKSWVGAQIASTGARPLVLAPAAVCKQTARMYDEYDVGGVQFVSYTKLQRADAADLLDRLQPDVLVLDEAHALRRVDTNSAARRIERYLAANPAARVACLTASLQSRDICDWGHLANWALRAASPVPRLRAARQQLADRMAASPEAREAFRARLAACPGVVGASSDSDYQGDVVLCVVRQPPALVLPPTWETPSGFLIESAAHAAVVEKNLAWGFYLDIVPRPSAPYCAARKVWGNVVRRCIDQGLADTEYQCRALRPEQYRMWHDNQLAEGTLAEPVPVWAAPLVLPPMPSGPTLVWAQSRGLQEAAAAQLGCPLFREGGRSATCGTYLPDYRGPLAVVSIEACHAGLNLQAFSHNVVLEPPSDPERIRQLIGRTARQGQTAPVVTCDFIINCESAARSLRTAIDRAQRVLQDIGSSSPLLQLTNTEF